MTRVQTQLGWLEGERRGEHLVFRGIPFGKPPTGALRFRAPEPPEPWIGVRPAREFGPSSVQPSGQAAASGPCSEDCLYLNVFTPRADSARRPVFFWLHGGAFAFGSGSEPLYDGGRLAERGDVVVVTVNYRLGALGFTHFAEGERARLGVTSNAGCLDQIAALRWVRDNIHQFGGDPDAVTIAGESAGAYSVAMLLGMPLSRGLFHRAITQSGARLLRGTDEPTRPTNELLRVLELPAGKTEALWDVPAERVIAAQQLVAARMGSPAGSVPFAPVCDGDTLPLPLERAMASGTCARVPLLIGTNRDELNLFLGPALAQLHETLGDPEMFEQLRALIPRADDERLRALIEVYRRSRASRQLPHADRAVLFAISSDGLWRVPSGRFAEAHRAHQPATFQYLFTYESPALRGAMRSCHALELAFVFGTLDAPGQAQFAGTGERVRRLSERMMDSWLAFTRTGDPSIAAPQQAWPAYDAQRRPTMVFNLESGLEHAPYEEERAAWDGLDPRPLH